jgi:hypothetical protein
VARRWLNAVRRRWWRRTTLAEKRWWTLTRKLLLLGRTLRCSERRVLRWEVCRCWLVRSGLLVFRRRREAAVGRWWWALRLLVRSEGILTRWARSTGCHGRLRLRHAISVVILVERRWRCRRVLQLCDPVATPVATSSKRWRCWSGRRAVVRLSAPWLTWRSTKCTWLVSLRMHILGKRRAGLVGKTVGRLSLEQSKTRLDVNVGGIKVSSPRVCVESVASLVVAGLVERTKVIPNLRNVRVEADGTRVRVKRVAVLVDLVVEHTNRAPEGRVATVTIDCLLVGFVGFGVLLLRHVATTEKVPTLSVVLVWLWSVK